MSQIHDLYRAAIAADDAYTATVKRVAGPKATRWTLPLKYHKHPEIVAAFQTKLDAYNAWETAYRAASERLDPYPFVPGAD